MPSLEITPRIRPSRYDVSKWESKHSLEIKNLDIIKAKHRIDSHKRYPVSEFNNAFNMDEFITQEGETWKLRTDFDAKSFAQNTPPSLQEVDTFINLLQVRQSLKIPKSETEQNHAKGLYFLSENWKRIRHIFSPPSPEDKFPPISFSEVDLRNYGRADFIGIGADGSLCIIEYGTRRKLEQVHRYSLGLQDLAKDYNITIFSYALSYSCKGSVNALQAQPLSEMAIKSAL